MKRPVQLIIVGGSISMLLLLAVVVLFLTHTFNERVRPKDLTPTTASQDRATGRIHLEYVMSGGASGGAHERRVIATDPVAPDAAVRGRQEILLIAPSKLGQVRSIIDRFGARKWTTEGAPKGISDGIQIDLRIALGDSDKSVVLFDSSFADYKKLSRIRQLFDELQTIADKPPPPN